MTDKPDRPLDIPPTPPTPGKTQAIPPEMPPAEIPTPEILPPPTPHPETTDTSLKMVRRKMPFIPRRGFQK